MTIQTLTKRQAVDRLKAEEVQLFQQGKTYQSEEMAEDRKLLEKGRGETLWDVYRNSGDRLETYRSLADTLAPETEWDSPGPFLRYTSMLAAGAAGSGLAAYLNGAGAWSIGAALVPFVAGFFCGGIVAAGQENGVNLGLQVGSVISGTAVTAFATQSWVWSGAALAGIGAVAVASAVGPYLAAERQVRLQNVVERHKTLFSQPPDPSVALGRKITKQDLIKTMTRVQDQAIQEGDFSKAMDLRTGMKALQRCPGQNFYEMLMASNEQQKEILAEYAGPVLEDARQRVEIQELIEGNDDKVDFLLGLETLTVGDQVISVDPN